MYRLLRTNGELRERRRQASRPPRTVPELVAGRPNGVGSHDATALWGPARGVNYDRFVMLDIFSRYSPGWLVADQESALVVRSWIEQIVAAQGPLPLPGPAWINRPKEEEAT